MVALHHDQLSCRRWHIFAAGWLLCTDQSCPKTSSLIGSSAIDVDQPPSVTSPGFQNSGFRLLEGTRDGSRTRCLEIAEVCSGTFASILACPHHVRQSNFGHGGYQGQPAKPEIPMDPAGFSRIKCAPSPPPASRCRGGKNLPANECGRPQRHQGVPRARHHRKRGRRGLDLGKNKRCHCRARPGNPSLSKNASAKMMDTRVKAAYDECGRRIAWNDDGVGNYPACSRLTACQPMSRRQKPSGHLMRSTAA